MKTVKIERKVSGPPLYFKKSGFTVDAYVFADMFMHSILLGGYSFETLEDVLEYRFDDEFMTSLQEYYDENAEELGHTYIASNVKVLYQSYLESRLEENNSIPAISDWFFPDGGEEPVFKSKKKRLTQRPPHSKLPSLDDLI